MYVRGTFLPVPARALKVLLESEQGSECERRCPDVRVAALHYTPPAPPPPSVWRMQVPLIHILIYSNADRRRTKTTKIR